MDIHVRRMAGKSSPVTSSHADYWKYYAANHFSEIQSGFTTGSSSATQSIEVNHVTVARMLRSSNSVIRKYGKSSRVIRLHRCTRESRPNDLR